MSTRVHAQAPERPGCGGAPQFSAATDAVAPAAAAAPDWSAIDTVLLDMDGTLLDLAFDTRFWHHTIPAAWAASRGTSIEQACARLAAVFRAREGTLDWYCVEYWSRELGLPVAQMKSAAAHEVAWLPGVPGFLAGLRAQGKRLVLVTNAHPVSLAVKDRGTGLTGLMDAVYSSHAFAAPKEAQAFWHALQQAEPFDAARTLFVDDSPAVLAAARTFGLRWVYGVRCPDSTGTRRDHGPHPAVDRITELA